VRGFYRRAIAKSRRNDAVRSASAACGIGIPPVPAGRPGESRSRAPVGPKKGILSGYYRRI